MHSFNSTQFTHDSRKCISKSFKIDFAYKFNTLKFKYFIIKEYTVIMSNLRINKFLFIYIMQDINFSDVDLKSILVVVIEYLSLVMPL